MTAPDYKDILNRAENYRNYAAETLSTLIKISSISGDEEKIVRYLEREFTSLGADQVKIDGFGNIIARLGKGSPVIAFDAHIDTVDIGNKDQWNFDPFSGEISDDIIKGRGASDQKGGMASMLTALRILKDLSDSYPFTVYFVGSILEEDCDGLCWQYIVKEEKLRPDVVVLTEPTDGKINRGQRGRMEIEIAATGISCHGSAPERGENAVYKIAPIISALEKLNDNLLTDDFLGKGTLTISRVRSNSPSLCAVADFAAVYLDRRLTAGETPEYAIKQLEELPEIINTGAKVTIPQYNNPSWKNTLYPTSKIYPAWVLPEDHHYVKKAAACFNSILGENPVIDKWTFSTNGVATMGLFDIPSLGYGPGMEKMAHAPNEYVNIDDLVRCAAFYAGYPWVLCEND